jgi:hypothetical protein
MDMGKKLLQGAIDKIQEQIDEQYETLWGLLPGYVTMCCCCCSAKTSIGLIFSCCGCMIPDEAKDIPSVIQGLEDQLAEQVEKLEIM